MKAQEIRTLSTGEVETRLNDAEEEFFNLRAQFVIGQLENFNRLTELKRDIARLKTILRERELAAETTHTEQQA
ncbi:MAG: 50S ribosomal protein L29 [Anaerolineales bacterium]|nr:MAG: 50S ribosomal protein L29 [Anaerolineales bacterium]